MTKFGPTYRIQVKLKDKVSGKLNVYSTTWKPKIGMTPKQMEREVIVYADQYEDNLRIQGKALHKIKRKLRAILSHAKKKRLIVDNYAIADYIDFPKRPSKEIDYMNDEDAKLFYAAALSYQDVRCKTAVLRHSAR